MYSILHYVFCHINQDVMHLLISANLRDAWLSHDKVKQLFLLKDVSRPNSDAV